MKGSIFHFLYMNFQRLNLEEHKYDYLGKKGFNVMIEY